MSIRTIQDTIMADFAALTLTGIAKVYPNIPYSGQKPYASLQFAHTNVSAVSIASGSKQVFEGFAIFTVVTELGRGLEAAAIAAATIAARYNFGRLITASGGRLEIPSPPYVMDGFRQDSDWRTPIRVPYRGFF